MDLFNHTPPTLTPLEVEFEQSFWPHYKRKNGKRDAFKAYKMVRKENSLASILDMLATRKVEWAKRNECFVPYAGSWLRSESFEEVDETARVPKIVSPSWNGTQAILEKHLGAEVFSAWLGPQTFIAGPPPKIICITQFQAHEIERKFRITLTRAFGTEIEIGVKP